MRTILVITQIPSPYQVEFFNHLARSCPGISLQVVYLMARDGERLWRPLPIEHEHVLLDLGGAARERAAAMCRAADFVLFSWYRDAFLRGLMKERELRGGRWAYWGERLGYTSLARFGGLYRRLALAPLHRSRASVWGIGQWAIDSWRCEFGDNRTYHNVPYFSDLGRYFDARAARPAESSTRTILYSGSLIERKGADLLARCFAQVAREEPSLRLIVAGDGPLRPMMEALLRSVSEQVEFLGFRDWAELPAIYACADVLCAPSRHDGWGLVVPEGLAAGLPVIATDRTGAAIDLVDEGRNGWFVRAGSEPALADAVRRVAKLDEDELRRMSASAILRAQSHTLEEGARRFLNACEFRDHDP